MCKLTRRSPNAVARHRLEEERRRRKEEEEEFNHYKNEEDFTQRQ